MKKFGNYEILEKLHETKNTEIFRARHIEKQIDVILKALKDEFPSAENIFRLNQEFQLLLDIDSHFCIKAYTKEKENTRFGITIEDIKGKSLQEVFTRKLNLSEFLNISTLMIKALSDVHRKNIIHKDINPSNFIYNSITNELKIIDFGISTKYLSTLAPMESPNSLEGTLSFISPEQTGRMNRKIDYRTDFYSLGITFYKLLTGYLPFSSLDPIELVHSHIAKQASPPHIIDSSIPIPVSDIIMKLISKTAEQRYNSCSGLLYDIEIACSGLINYNEHFPCLGTKDVSEKFKIPQKIYGREIERKILLSAFDRIIHSKREMLLIVGYSGIGKSSLVAEIYKPITERHGYFISGKFDQFNRNIPYKAFVNIYQDLVKQLLGETDSNLQIWRDKILAAVGENGQLIIDVIPELELVIGKQLPVVVLGGNESQNRFNLFFQKFMEVFIQREHPLVIFLDDLQWADAGSLKLIHLLMNSKLSGLLLIGAYRENDVSSLHPLSITLNEIEKSGAILNYVSLAPLELSTAKQYIADAFNSNSKEIGELGELIYSKTGGNPFFMNEFLKSLYSEEFVKYDSQNFKWTWNLEEIKSREYTNNVVELMNDKIKKLPESTKEILKLAACIGNQFDLKTLVLVSEKSEEYIIEQIVPAISENYLSFIGYVKKANFRKGISLVEERIPEYKFAHDRVQQAAYALIPESERGIFHYQIGKLLEKQLSEEVREEKIFTIINHLNHGISFIQNPLEKIRLAKLNLIASKRARDASAYQATIEYAQNGILLLGDNSWTESYNLILELHDLATEVSFLLGNYELMNEWMDAVTNNAGDTIDLVNVYFVKIQSLASQNKFIEAISTGKYILEKLGAKFPENPNPNDFVQAMHEITELMGKRRPEDLFYLPKMVDKEKIAIMNIAACLIPVCYNAGSPLFPLTIILQVNYSIKYGNSLMSSFSYTNYGILLNNIMVDVEKSDEFRKLAYRLSLEPECKPVRCATFTGIGIFLLHRTTHLKNSIEILQAGYQIGLETGALELAGYSGYAISLNSFWSGENLQSLKEKICEYRKNLRNFGQLTSANYCSIFLEITIALLDNPEDKSLLDPENNTTEELVLTQALGTGDRTRLFYYYLHRMVLYYITGEMKLASEDAVKIKEYLMAGGGTIGEIGFHFYDTLLALISIKLKKGEPISKLEESSEWKRVLDGQSQIEIWAKYAPMNHKHKWLLIEAEKSRVLGRRVEAEDLYDQAIELANKNGYLQEEALANELCGNFWLEIGKKEFAKIYFRKAYYVYSLWGANKKMEILERKFPGLVAALQDNNEGIFNSHTLVSKTITQKTTRLDANMSLDFLSIFKALQIISGEIILDKLLNSLMKVLSENAGAEKGYLLLEQDKGLAIESSWEENRLSLSKVPFTSENTQLSSSVIFYVRRTKLDLVVEDISKDDRFKDFYIRQNNPKSILCIPLLNQGRLVGIIYFENNLTASVFSSDRIDILKMLSSQAAISIENARLYANLESLTEEKTRVTTEMEIAKDIQTSLLPAKPTLSGFDVAAYMQTAELVGGDYYDVIRIDDKEWFLIGDVSGHGVSAGLIMMMTQTAIHTILNSLDTRDPSLLLKIVNKVITENIKKMKLNKYMTLTLFLKDADGTLYYSGMHQDLIIYISKTKKVKVIESKGSWLGYYDLHNEYEVDSIKLESNDTLLLFTDGVTESMNNKEEMFEIDGLIKLLEDHGNESSEYIKKKILESLLNYKTNDDITFMICKRK